MSLHKKSPFFGSIHTGMSNVYGNLKVEDTTLKAKRLFLVRTQPWCVLWRHNRPFCSLNTWRGTILTSSLLPKFHAKIFRRLSEMGRSNNSGTEFRKAFPDCMVIGHAPSNKQIAFVLTRKRKQNMPKGIYWNFKASQEIFLVFFFFFI